MVGVFPPFANYQAATTRHIPIVMMTAIAAIDVFSMIDGGAGDDL